MDGMYSRMREKGLLSVVREKLPDGGLSGFERHRQWLVLAAIESRVVDRRELLTRATRADAVWRFGESERFTLADDRSRDLPTVLHRRLGTYTNDRPFVCELRDAALVGKEPIGVTAGHEIVLELADAHRAYLWFRLSSHLEGHSLPDAVRETRRLVRERPQPTSSGYDLDAAFPLVKTGVDTYYHWVLEWLPKVRALECYREQTGRSPEVLVPAEMPSWMRETFSLVGLDLEDCIPYEGAVSVDRLVVPSHRNRVLPVPWMPFPDEFHPSPADCRWLRERITSNLPADATPPRPATEHDHPPRVYVSRRDADHHRVVNEEAVLEVLEPLGFESYALEEHSVAEQVALFRDAEVVIAPHGSGLVNLVYAKSDPTVVELFKRNDIRAFYYVLARQLGLSYEYLVGEDVDGDIRIEPNAVRSVATEAIERAQPRQATGWVAASGRTET